MAEMPIGTWPLLNPLLALTPKADRVSPRSSQANNPEVLDGGTGFLKVGYAAQVCRIDSLDD